MIYLDNAATTLCKPQEVGQAVANAINNFGNASRGAHGYSLNASRTVYDTREKIADFFGLSNPQNVIFTCNATEGLNIAICGTINDGDHVITTDWEHNSVLRPLYELEENRHVSVDFVRSDKNGCIDYTEFERLIRKETKAIICTHASNLTGNVIDLRYIGDVASRHNLLFIVDASQTAGMIPIDMEKEKIDILIFTGHKALMGPQGTGGICIREGVEIRPLKRGGSGIKSYDRHQPMEYPTRLEAGTLNSHGIAGLSAAIDYINAVGIEKIQSREKILMSMFYNGVADIEGVMVYGDFSMSSEKSRTGIVTLNIRNYDSGEVADELAEKYGIAVRAGAHCAPRMHEALGTTKCGAVRFSFSYFNTEEEVQQAILAVKEIASQDEML